MITSTELQQTQTMRSYYRWQSKIYDATRWSFLFGRLKVLKKIPLDRQGKWKIMEVGCGTGINLAKLAKLYPNASLYGIDVSSDMLKIASARLSAYKRRIHLEEGAYPIDPLAMEEQFDVILFSYSLTMINPKWSVLIKQAYHDLKPGGYLAAVDFHDSAVKTFKHHMSNNHVRMDSHLVPLLNNLFDPFFQSIHNAYGGIWQFFIWIGKKGI